jgi:hypothetical protein
MYGKEPGANFGHAVSTAGDVNGDGCADVLVGAPKCSNDQVREGRVYVLYGKRGPSAEFSGETILEWDQAYAQFGFSVAAAGDVNGDGYSDILVGAPYGDSPETNEGVALVYLGSALGITGEHRLLQRNQAGALFGWSTSTAGDVNGDGFSDILVGAPQFDHPETNEGLAFLYLGSSTVPVEGEPLWFEQDQAGALLGWSVSTAGDFNRDGYSDVLLGAPLFDLISGSRVNAGCAFLKYGAPSGLPLPGPWFTSSMQPYAMLGFSVASAGDVNGDGCSDVAIGAPRTDSEWADQGSVLVQYGGPTGSSSGSWMAFGPRDRAWYGHAVSTAGDVNGDGYDDVMMGAPMHPNVTGPEGGRAYVHYGNGGSGAPVTPSQSGSDASGAPMTSMGGRLPAHQATLRLAGGIGMGSGRAKLQCQVKALGAPYDLTGISEGAWTSGPSFSHTVTGLLPNTVYHGRVRLRSLPFLTYGKWHSVGPNGSLETDFRTPP